MAVSVIKEDYYVTRKEHNEFSKRIDEENTRQNQRIRLLEEQNKQIFDIALSVKELAISVKQMAETQNKQGERLEEIEKRDGLLWRKFLGYMMAAIVGAIISFVFSQIGM